jgi:hypothetical protein
MNAGDVFKAHVKLSELEQVWQTEIERFNAMADRLDELIKTIPCRELGEVLETQEKKFRQVVERFGERIEQLYDDLLETAP